MIKRVNLSLWATFASFRFHYDNERKIIPPLDIFLSGGFAGTGEYFEARVFLLLFDDE